MTLASYLDSSARSKNAIRHALAQSSAQSNDKAKRRFERRYALTLPAGNAIDARILHDVAPDIRIWAVEKFQAPFQEMQENGPASMICVRGTLDSFIKKYQGSDGHFVSVFFDFLGPLTMSNIVTIMNFVADHRFMKPGGRTSMGFTFNVANRRMNAVGPAIAYTLQGPDGYVVRHCLSTVAVYIMRALKAQCPELKIELKLKRVYKNGPRKQKMYAIVLEAEKPLGCPEYEPVTSEWKNGWFGDVYIPAGSKRKPGAKAGRRRSGPINADLGAEHLMGMHGWSAKKALATLAGYHGAVTEKQYTLLEKAALGGAYPRSGTKEYALLQSVMKSDTLRARMFRKCLAAVNALWLDDRIIDM